jgi:hypothetical protein
MTEQFGKTANLYRRSFNWRLSNGSSMTEPDIAVVRLQTGDLPDILEDFLLTSRRRSLNPTSMCRLQMHLLGELTIQEQATKHYKSKLAMAGTHREMVEGELFKHGMTANALRIIGDGIAWRAFRFDRLIPRVLSGHPVKHVIGEAGLQAELNEFHAVIRKGRSPILNCTTNCLAIGDLTVIDKEENVEIIEVKSGNTRCRRTIKQKNKMREVVQFLEDAQGDVEGVKVFVDSFPITPKNFLPSLSDLLEESQTSGWASSLLSADCFVECIDFGHGGDLAGEIEKMNDQQSIYTTSWGNDALIEMDSRQILTFAPNIAPFSIYPFRERICIDLMIGKTIFRSIVNASEVARSFERAGWTVKALLGDALTLSENRAVLIVEKGGCICHLPPGDFAKLQFEMLRVETLIEECEYIKGRGPRPEGEFGVWKYAGEHLQWA